MALFSFLLPSGDDCLNLSIEIDSRLAVEVQVAQERSFASSKGHHGQGYRDREVNSDLPTFNVSLEFPGR